MHEIIITILIKHPEPLSFEIDTYETNKEIVLHQNCVFALSNLP